MYRSVNPTGTAGYQTGRGSGARLRGGRLRRVAGGRGEPADAVPRPVQASAPLLLPGRLLTPRRGTDPREQSEGLERLCRYAVRPPFALYRLSQGSAGHLLYKTKRPRSGALSLLRTLDQLLAQIATLVPPPRTHAIRYHGGLCAQIEAPSTGGAACRERGARAAGPTRPTSSDTSTGSAVVGLGRYAASRGR